MDKETHGRLLRRAMAERGLSNELVADATGVGVRTVSNWRNGVTLPDDAKAVSLRRLLGDYDQADGVSEVETAVRRSPLIKWRQDTVIATYERNLYEQQQAGEVGA